MSAVYQRLCSSAYGALQICFMIMIIYNSFPVILTTIAKNRHFYIPRPSFLFALGTPCGNHAKRCMNEKTFQCLPNPSQHVYPSILNSFQVIRTASAKNRRFLYRRPHFCFPWRRPCDYHAICCMDGKTIQCLPNPSQHVPIHIK